jgi:hypothetical protein
VVPKGGGSDLTKVEGVSGWRGEDHESGESPFEEIRTKRSTERLDG